MSGSFDRRDFLRQTAAAGMAIGMAGQAFSAPSTKKSGGKKADTKGKAPAPTKRPVDNVPPSERIQVAVVGVNGRGKAHIQCLAQIPGVDITHICEVDSRALAGALKLVKSLTGKDAVGIKDFRKLIEIKEITAITLATPDFQHALMSVMALAAGKHVYCEKPATHNAQEGEMLVRAVEKSGKVFQMGNQRRSYPEMQRAIREIQSGKLIGNAYFARCWYGNVRVPIGIGKPAPVPAWLGADGYDLWQGPAPRRPFKDNVIHYKWHWFWHWGTAESVANGSHEYDICRWALGVNMPSRVVSTGGRYHFTGPDDWECPDTQVVSMDFPEGKAITWEGRCCNHFLNEGLERGSMIHGTEGSVLLDGHNVIVYDLKGKEIPEKRVTGGKIDGTNVITTDIQGDTMHFFNFIQAVRGLEKPNSPVALGVMSCLPLHLGNIALRTGSTVVMDPRTGRIADNEPAQKLWGREYEKGWEPQQYL